MNNPPVTMETRITEEAVYYSVMINRHILWHREVKFGKSAAYRAGGYAFKDAAREQERFAFNQAKEQQHG